MIVTRLFLFSCPWGECYGQVTTILYLHRGLNRDMSAGELERKFSLPVTALTQILSVLRFAGYILDSSHSVDMGGMTLASDNRVSLGLAGLLAADFGRFRTTNAASGLSLCTVVALWARI